MLNERERATASFLVKGGEVLLLGGGMGVNVVVQIAKMGAEVTDHIRQRVKDSASPIFRREHEWELWSLRR